MCLDCVNIFFGSEIPIFQTFVLVNFVHISYNLLQEKLNRQFGRFLNGLNVLQRISIRTTIFCIFQLLPNTTNSCSDIYIECPPKHFTFYQKREDHSNIPEVKCGRSSVIWQRSTLYWCTVFCAQFVSAAPPKGSGPKTHLFNSD